MANGLETMYLHESPKIPLYNTKTTQMYKLTLVVRTQVFI